MFTLNWNKILNIFWVDYHLYNIKLILSLSSSFSPFPSLFLSCLLSSSIPFSFHNDTWLHKHAHLKNNSPLPILVPFSSILKFCLAWSYARFEHGITGNVHLCLPCHCDSLLILICCRYSLVLPLPIILSMFSDDLWASGNRDEITDAVHNWVFICFHWGSIHSK